MIVKFATKEMTMLRLIYGKIAISLHDGIYLYLANNISKIRQITFIIKIVCI